MKILISLCFVIIVSIKAFSTSQYPDKIIIEGKEYDLFTNPLEPYFEKNPEKRPKSSIKSSALWRGYVATFEIIDSTLYLKDIKIQKNDNKWLSVIEEVFPGNEKIIIDWFSGLFVIPDGKLVNYVHMGYGSSYEKYILLHIDKGYLKKIRKMKNNEYEAYKEKQYQEYKKTEEYSKLVQEIKKEGDSEEFIDSFIKSYVSSYTTIILKEE